MNSDDGPDVALRKLSQQPGVLGYVVLSKKGIPVKYHNMDSAKALHYASLLERFTVSTRDFLEKRLFQADDDAVALRSIRLHTLQHEIVICPEENYTLVVLHKAGGDGAILDLKPIEAEEQKKDEEQEDIE